MLFKKYTMVLKALERGSIMFLKSLENIFYKIHDNTSKGLGEIKQYNKTTRP